MWRLGPSMASIGVSLRTSLSVWLSAALLRSIRTRSVQQFLCRDACLPSSRPSTPFPLLFSLSLSLFFYDLAFCFLSRCRFVLSVNLFLVLLCLSRSLSSCFSLFRSSISFSALSRSSSLLARLIFVLLLLLTAFCFFCSLFIFPHPVPLSFHLSIFLPSFTFFLFLSVSFSYRSKLSS